MYDVVCTGILVADVLAKTVEGLPDKGKLEQVDRIELFPGGCAVNAAIAMARLGINVALIGKIGKDGFGNFISNALQRENVDIQGLVEDEKCGTSASVVTVDSTGERTFLHSIGANGEFTYEDIDWQVIENSKIVFIAGTMLMPKFDGKQCADFLQSVQKAGHITALDTAWDSTGRWMEILEPCMKHIDLFMPSIEEAIMLSGEKEPDKIANLFLSMGVKTVVLKLGKKGCYIKSPQDSYCIPTYTRYNAVDTTGAGDSFAAGFLTGLSKGWGLYQCGVFANAVGTHCVMSAGASTGIRSFDETIDFINSNQLGG
ncbi:MAG: carbohydrate kinase family protein [Clostridiaceae bacterium]|nr:carbohydrate kinase family protein [Clostridiaceae bacterium]